MANRHRGEFEFTAGDKTYTLQFSHQALIRLEEKLDKSLLTIINAFQAWSTDPASMRLGMIRDMLWAGLQRHHPEMSPGDVADLLDDIEGHAAGAVEILGTAMTRAFDAPKTKGANPPPATAVTNGTGTNSGSSGSALDKTRIGSGSSPLANTD